MENMFLYQNLNNNQLHIESSLLSFNKLSSFMQVWLLLGNHHSEDNIQNYTQYILLCLSIFYSLKGRISNVPMLEENHHYSLCSILYFQCLNSSRNCLLYIACITHLKDSILLNMMSNMNLTLGMINSYLDSSYRIVNYQILDILGDIQLQQLNWNKILLLQDMIYSSDQYHLEMCLPYTMSISISHLLLDMSCI